MAADSSVASNTGISSEEIRVQIAAFEEQEGMSPTLGRMLSFLCDKDLYDLPRRSSREVLLAFAVAENGGKDVPREDTAYDGARQNFLRLQKWLKAYYHDMPKERPPQLVFEFPKPRTPEEKRKRYKVRVSRFIAPPNGPLLSDFEPRGNSVAALEYVTERIPLLNRIEETFVRWADTTDTLYEDGGAFDRFIDALSTSKLLYRAILAPSVDPVVTREHGLREALANRLLEYKAKPSVKLFRMRHGAPLMSFTLLYYADKSKGFYEDTQDIEVLFGFGVYASLGNAEDTAVFSTRHPRLCLEFLHQFKALRSSQFSFELDVQRPHHFSIKHLACDVIGTFQTFPLKEIIERIRACGREKGSPKFQASKPHITICVSAFRQLNDPEFRKELKVALSREGVQVNVALWKPGSSFLKLRERVIVEEDDPDPEAFRQEIEDNRRLIEGLGYSKNLTINWCTSPAASVSIFWIDEFIYFSAYWIGKAVSDGPHFMVAASSDTGIELQAQYKSMLSLKEDIPEPKKSG